MAEQIIITISPAELAGKVEQFKKEDYRIEQICATRIPETLEMSYSFSKGFDYTTLRLVLPLSGAEIKSISDIYLSAFLYENEIHDLFGVKFPGLVVDFAGSLYRTAVATPFNPPVTTAEEGKA